MTIDLIRKKLQAQYDLELANLRLKLSGNDSNDESLENSIDIHLTNLAFIRAKLEILDGVGKSTNPKQQLLFG